MSTTLKISSSFIVSIKRNGEIEASSHLLSPQKDAPKKHWKFAITKNGIDYAVDATAYLYNIIQDDPCVVQGLVCFPMPWHKVFLAMKQKSYLIAMEYITSKAEKGAIA